VSQVPGGHYTVDQTTGEVKLAIPEVATRGNTRLGDLASLRAWCATETSGGDIVIGRTGNTVACTPAKALKHTRSTAAVAFFDRFIPKSAMNLRQFTGWLDLLRAGIPEADMIAIDRCLQAVTIGEASTSTVTQTGAAINVKVEAGRGLTSERPFPKRITAMIPFGDPSHVTPVTFSLTLEAKGSELLATAAVDEMELGVGSTCVGPRDRFVEWAQTQLAGLDKWTVMVGE
jgi:hypothetical protein